MYGNQLRALLVRSQRPWIWLIQSMLLGVQLMLPAPTVWAELVISEIMFNPKSSEASPNDVEWVEVFDTGSSAVDVSGWSLQDEDGSTDMLPMGSSIASGEAIVLSSLSTAPGGTSADFQAAWGSGFQAFALDFSAMGGLANSPSSTNESLSLVNSTMNIIDTVDFDDSAPWPSDSPDGPSIYLLSNSLDTLANDLGANWARSVDGIDGAFANNITDRFGGLDIGSPGHVATAVPEPGSFALLAVITAAGVFVSRRKWWPGVQLALSRRGK